MMPDKKIIAFDVDGTLTVSKSTLANEMANLLKDLLKRKMVFVISGGDFPQLENQFLPLFMNDEACVPFLHNMILLPTSGSKRYEYSEEGKKWVLTFRNPLDQSVKDRTINLLKEIISNSNLYDIPPNPAGEIIEDRDTQITFSALGQKAKVEDKKAWDPDQNKRKKIKAELEPKLPEVSLLINAYSSIDILPKGFNKAVGLGMLLDKLGLNKKDMLYVGDALFPGGNDYSVKEAGMDCIEVKGPEETGNIIRGWIGQKQV